MATGETKAGTDKDNKNEAKKERLRFSECKIDEEPKRYFHVIGTGRPGRIGEGHLGTIQYFKDEKKWIWLQDRDALLDVELLTEIAAKIIEITKA